MKALIFSEDKDIVMELLNVIKNFHVDDVYISSVNLSEKETSTYGDNKIINLRVSKEALLLPKSIADMLNSIIRKYNIDMILVGATRVGREIVAYLAQYNNVDYLSESHEVWVDGEGLHGKRYILTGKVLIEEVLKEKPYIASIAPHAYEKLRLEGNPRIVEEIELTSVKDERVKILEISKYKSEAVNIENAKIIVSVGRGFKSKEDIQLAFELAKLLGGEVGCSRPIAADLKWLSEDRWIGLSGHKVKPDLYIAIGISGQTQHIAGIKDSKIIVAINIDKGAPIFKYADYGIVGDLYKVVPLLIDSLKSFRS